MADLVGRYPALQELIAAARAALLSAFPGCAEEPDSRGGLIGYNYGPGYKGVVATLIFSKGGLKIGIPYGAELKDPLRLLEGSGKVHRHIPVKTIEALEEPGLKRLLAATLLAWQVRARGA